MSKSDVLKSRIEELIKVAYELDEVTNEEVIGLLEMIKLEVFDSIKL